MPTAHREVESKYDVGDATAVPDLADLPGVARVDGPVTHLLEATYFDTADLALGRQGITLRRRTGGDDAGWHLKLPDDGARQEIRASLGRSTRTPPVALRRIVQGVVRRGVLEPIATLTTERSVVSLLDADGALLAIFCDDRVAATRTNQDGDETQSWREWEVEQHGARPKLVKAADRRVRDTGAQLSTQGSKFGRVVRLGSGNQSVAVHAPGKRTTEHELIQQHLATLIDELHRLDPLVRADLPDAVHKLRTVCRRLRGLLGAFDMPLDTAATDETRDKLRWIRDVLAQPRDLEVVRDMTSSLLGEQPAHLIRERPGPWIDARLRAARRSALGNALDAMASDRYLALVGVLDSWHDTPPWADQKDRSARKRLPAKLDHEWSRVKKAAAAASAGEPVDRPVLLHKVRTAAKRARYAAEVLEPVLGSGAGRMGRDAKRIQRVLGEYNDALLTAGHLRELTVQAHRAGRDTFTFGVLVARLESEAAEHERDFERFWRTLRTSRRG